MGVRIKELYLAMVPLLHTYDPATALKKLHCPVLAMNGEKDLQVSSKQNLPAIRKALEEGGNVHFEVGELPGLSHLFQTAKTGSPSEYSEIEETVSTVALQKLQAGRNPCTRRSSKLTQINYCKKRCVPKIIRAMVRAVYLGKTQKTSAASLVLLGNLHTKAARNSDCWHSDAKGTGVGDGSRNS